MTDPKIAGKTEGEAGATAEQAAARVAGSAGWTQAVVREVKSHPFGYGVLAAFAVLGPLLVTMIFPDAPPAAVAVGGLVFGVYAALCAVPQKFM